VARNIRRALNPLSHQSTARGAGIPILATIATVMVLSASTITPILAEPVANPGHALAQRFAEDAERARASEAARKDAAKKASDLRRKEQAQKKWEAEMLARAKAEAEERRQLEVEAARLDAARMAREALDVDAARRTDEIERAAEALRLAAERAAADEARKAADLRRVAEEKELDARRIEAARLAEETQRAQNARLAEEGRRAEAARIEALRKAEASARAAEDVRRAEHAAWAAEEASRAADAQVAVKRATDDEARRIADLEAADETQRVAARLRVIRDDHLARHMREGESAPPTGEHVPSGGIGRIGVPTVPETPRAAERPQVHKAADAPSLDDAPSRAYSPTHDGRVTILLQMESNGQRGRRHESMDPVLCLVDGCYVSNGPGYPASFLPGRKATRFGNAISRRAGACNHAYTCVFRDVDIGTLPAEVQPVDIRVVRHDRRAPETVEALSTCRGTSGQLACTGAIHGDGYTMWVIPERVVARLPIELFGVTGGTADSGDRFDPRSAMAQPRGGRW
jgi:hypothetical protein